MDLMNEESLEFDVLKEDFIEIAESGLSFDEYKGRTILITGATGLIGSLIIKALLYCNKHYNLNLRIIAVIRNTNKIQSVFANEIYDEALSFLHADMINENIEYPLDIDYIIHGASITASKEMVTEPVKTILTAINGTKAVLKLAIEKNVRSMVYLSSMEIYGNMGTLGTVTEEDMLGSFDLSAVRSCYPESKRMCECLCTAYASQYDLNVMCIRLAQTFGAGITSSENRVFAQFARSAIHKKNITLHTSGLSEGNYVYTSDAIVAILLVLLKGKKGHAYNVSNEANHTTIKEMAELVAKKIANNEIQVNVKIPYNDLQFGYAPDVKLFMDTAKIKKLGWSPKVGLLESYQRLIQWMLQQKLY